ncbi:M56 family peptidase [Streptomyces armeniacus]|uniref:M56 family peptidase n=1 Tax=Streptomyces armeniacus TaxID=83291 RepID=A0A345XRY7_9ACTN|nr:M56 family metallopeptidase [Streptomyces armeniacus]AXK34403.1 M56 family peptidase [Streptomyces armeniacus]
MTSALALAAYAVLVGVLAPYAVTRARWPHRTPAAAVFVWHGLMVTFVVTTALAAYHLIVGERHVHSGVQGLLNACGLVPAVLPGQTAPLGADTALLLAVLVLLLPVGWFVHTVRSTRRVQGRHRDMLALVGVPAPKYGATIVEHDTPVVYCLPGRYRQVVVTTGAVEVLSPEQLYAVLEHERAHIAGRHHLLHAVPAAFERTFPRLPLAVQAREQTALLLEMIADDRALRACSHEVLAEAICEVAAGQAPRAAFGAGGSNVSVRVRRILDPRAVRRPSPGTWWGVVSGAAAVALVPLLLSC